MKLYLTGGTGLIGSNVIAVARRLGLEVIASQYGPEPEWPVDYQLDPLDLNNHAAIHAAINRHKPDVVIHCAALLDQVFMYHQRAKAWAFMVAGTGALARACRDAGARLIFVSTDWVFDGREAIVDEDSPPFPLNFYGLMKMASEQQLAGMDDLDYAVGRLAAVYGLNRAIPSATRWDQGIGLGDLPNYYVKQFHRGEPVEVWSTGAVNEAAHPTLASDAAEMLVKLARSTLRGTFHTCGSESCTRVTLAHRCARVFGGDPGLIQEVALDPEVARQHADIRPPYRLVMSVDKTAQLLDHRAYDVDGGLEVFKRQLEEEDLL